MPWPYQHQDVVCKFVFKGGPKSRLVGGLTFTAVDAMGEPASKVGAALSAELMVRSFSAGVQLDRSLNLALVRLSEWVSLVLNDGIKHALGQVPGTQTCDLSMDLVSVVAEHIVGDAVSRQQRLLRKSMEETLFYVVRPDPELSRSQFELRVKRFLERRGVPAILRNFLSLHLFNTVWSQTAQAFRMLAGTEELFLRYTRDVEHACRRIVSGCWNSHQIVLPFADSFPEKLLNSIEERFQEPRIGF